MRPTEDRPELTWFVVESGDRWYRATCRLVPGRFNHQTLLRIVRVLPANASSLVARMRGIRGQKVVLWEISSSHKSSDPVEVLDLVSLIRTEVPRAYQVALVADHLCPDWFLGAQEAGISQFLESIESLAGLDKAIQRRIDSGS
jgi:hypothetical protein